MNIPLKKMTAEDYATWAEAQTEGRFELIDGVVVQMNSEMLAHARVKNRIARSLETALAQARLEGEVFVDGMALRISDRIVHEPDAMVRLGPLLPGETILITDPVIVVEVLSPSTGPIDTSVKLVNYFKVPSVQHYLIVNTAKQLVLHYARRADGPPEMSVIEKGPVTLVPPGLTLHMSDLFG